TFERKDLVRVWEEFPAGPEGIFLKKGKVVHVVRSDRFPFARWVKTDDPAPTRFYYSKSYIYPLFVAPFVFAFGTNGFLIFNGLLLALDLFVAYAFLVGRGSKPGAALAYASVFLLASAVPVYFVWLTPEVFSFSVALFALFFWSHKESGRLTGFLASERSDDLAAALVGILTFSKPIPAALLMCPMVALAVFRRQWRRAAMMAGVWAVVTGALFVVNVALTGEFNYQGGYRKTFYGRSGFPLANDRETFDSIGAVHGREGVMVGDVLANKHTLTVFRRNLVYFVFGRSAGLVPYFFPGVLSALLFFARSPRRPWQWLVLATALAGMVAMLLLWPFPFSGGGGPVGNRYFLTLYPLLLLLTPPLAGPGSAIVGLAVGALFTAKIVLNPIAAS